MNRFSKSHRAVKNNIKACMVAYTFYEGDGRVRRYAETLAKRGDHVDVIALRRKGQSNHEIINGVNLYRIQTRSYDEKGKLSFLYRLIKFFINSALFLTKKHVANPYDIIHVHSVPDFEVFTAIIPKLLGAKIILDIHDPVPDLFAAKFGFDQNSLYVLLLKLIERLSTWYADYVITVTDYWKEVIKRRSNLSENKISVIVNFPDIKMFNIRNFPKLRKPNEEFMLLYPGTLNKHCGLDIVIKAVSILKNEAPSLRLHIYGVGNELENLQLLVRKLDLEKFILFHGVIPLDNVPELMNNADAGIALLSGHNEYSKQALNVKLFEFLAMGLPAIATRTNSIEYYIGEDVVMLSKPNDYRDVAKCIKELYLNPNKRLELQKKGLKFAQDHNWDTEMHVYMSIIDHLKKT